MLNQLQLEFVAVNKLTAEKNKKMYSLFAPGNEKSSVLENNSLIQVTDLKNQFILTFRNASVQIIGV